MVYPVIRLNQLYSLNLFQGLDIIFEDLSLIDIKALETAIKTKNYDVVTIVPRALTINTKKKSISVFGQRISNKTYIINHERLGDINLISYDCPEKNIIQGLEYLYHMIKNLK